MKYCKRALKIKVTKLDMNHPETADSHDCCAMILRKISNIDNSGSSYQKSLLIRKKKSGP